MDIKEFKKSIPQYKAIIGFDYGEKRLGVAVSDLLQMVATSHSIIYRQNDTKDFADIKKIIADKEIKNYGGRHGRYLFYRQKRSP